MRIKSKTAMLLTGHVEAMPAGRVAEVSNEEGVALTQIGYAKETKEEVNWPKEEKAKGNASENKDKGNASENKDKGNASENKAGDDTTKTDK